MPDALISYPFTVTGLKSALTALGTTADAVARNLDAMGFRGCKNSESNCPVANYLLTSITDACRVQVLCGDASVLDSADNRISADWPPAVDEFIELFDNGRLPSLEDSDASS
jgi:hypothetical protein